MRLIDADALDEVVLNLNTNCDFGITRVDYKLIDSVLFEFPTIEERKKGKWNVYYHGINEMPSFSYSCNQCGYSSPYGLYGGKYEQKKWRFCPNCGADMRGGQNG